MKILRGAVFLLAFIIVITNYANLGLLVSLAFFGLAIFRFIVDRRELKAANLYARIKEPTSIWKQIGFLLALSIFIVGLYYFLKFYEIKVFQNNVDIYLLILSIGSWVENHYLPFVNAIRSFDLGIKLPGRKQPLLYWKDITNFSLENTTVTIRDRQSEKHFTIDDRDLEDMNGMINAWEVSNS